MVSNGSLNDMFRVIMKINGHLQNYSCLITSSIDNRFIIPPPLSSTALHFKQSHNSIFPCAGAELEADEVHGVDSAGECLCQSLRCDLQNSSAGHDTQPFHYMLNN